MDNHAGASQLYPSVNKFKKGPPSCQCMPTLLACLSTGKGTWSEVNRVMQAQPWNKVFLIANQFGMANYQPNSQHVQMIPIDTFLETPALVEEIKKQLQGKISDFEVGLNLASGSGKEHMALLEAVMQLGLNFRLVTEQNGQVEVLGLKR